jgi:hypothetical protein
VQHSGATINIHLVSISEILNLKRFGISALNINMIVNYTEDGWEIVTQRSHGLLAAQICAQWQKDNQPERWVETLIATAEHDDVYNEFENAELLTESGGPKNFAMTSFQKEYASKLIDMALTKGRYIGLLVARHINFLHGEDPEGKKYCAELKKKEGRWLQEAKTTKRELDASYSLLEFCDAFSLLICQKMVQPEQRKVEISNGPDGIPYVLSGDEEGNLVVEPWPFELREFKVNLESRLLKQLVFTSVESFRDAIRDSPVTLRELRLRKRS